MPNASPSVDGIDLRRPTPVVSGTVASAATVGSVDSRRTAPTLAGGASSVAAPTVDVRSVRLTQTGPSFVARLDFVSTPNLAVSGVLDVIAGATQFPVSSGRTLYLGLLEDASIAEVEIPMPAGQVLELVVEADSAPGTGKSFAYEIMKNGATSGLGVSTTDSATGGYVTGTLSFSRRDRFALRIVTSAGAASAKHKFSLRYLVAGG